MFNGVRSGRFQIVLGILIIMLTAGCSGGSPSMVADPDNEIRQDAAVGIPSFGNPGHQCWGIWQFIIDKVAETVELVPVREAGQHLNVLGFLEPPVLTSVSLNWNSLVIDFANNYVEVGVFIRNPFIGLNEFTGFDVRGVLITDGTNTLSDTSEIFSGSNEPRLANPDGLTRWWNPSEFLGGSLHGYTPGLLGAPGGASTFGATLNGYKYYCKGLDADEPVSEMNFTYRGHFPVGQQLERTYRIDFGKSQSDFLIFNYAVDASWEFPDKVPPVIPDDFSLSANMLEPFLIDVDVIRSGLYYIESASISGGWIELDIMVHDWQGAESIGDVYIDNPEVLEEPVLCDALPITDPNKRGFHVATNNTSNISSNDPQDIIIKVYSNEGTYQQGGVVPFFGPPSTQLCAYHRVTFECGEQPIAQLNLQGTTLLPDPQPITVVKDFSVIGAPSKEGVYYFGSNYEMYRYPLNYSSEGELFDTLFGFLNYSPDDLWAYPIMLGKLDMTQQGEYVMHSESTDAGFLPPYLVRDFAFQFDGENNPFGHSPEQGISPYIDTGIMKVIDISSTSNFDDSDVVFWIYNDDEAEPSTPIPGITTPLLYFRFPYGPDIFGGDIGVISGNPIPEGMGPGVIVSSQVKAFAVSGDPFTAEFGYWDIVIALLELPNNEIELYGINCTDPTEASNEYLTTITEFQGSPMDIEMIPAKDAGFDIENDWIAVLEQGSLNQSVLEIFSHDGTKLNTSQVLPGQPVAMDVDPYNYGIHVWYKDVTTSGEPIYAAVFMFET